MRNGFIVLVLFMLHTIVYGQNLKPVQGSISSLRQIEQTLQKAAKADPKNEGAKKLW